MNLKKANQGEYCSFPHCRKESHLLIVRENGLIKGFCWEHWVDYCNQKDEDKEQALIKAILEGKL